MRRSPLRRPRSACSGCPGLTAWVGLVDIGQIKEGETLYVSGAAGAVGSTAAQIAKLKGLRVIGSAGSTEKVEWLRSLGIEAFNYREQSPKEALADGIDVFFDNVGGEQLEAALERAAPVRSRDRLRSDLALQRRASRARPPQSAVHRHQAAAHAGLHRVGSPDRLPAFIAEVGPWVAAGKLQYRETVLDGIENVPAAFAGLFRGDNTGKMLVRVGPD